MVFFWIYRTLANGGWAAIKKSAQPTESWGPSDPADREGTKYSLPKYAMWKRGKTFEDKSSVRPPSRNGYLSDRFSLSVNGDGRPYNTFVNPTDPRLNRSGYSTNQPDISLAYKESIPSDSSQEKHLPSHISDEKNALSTSLQPVISLSETSFGINAHIAKENPAYVPDIPDMPDTSKEKLAHKTSSEVVLDAMRIAPTSGSNQPTNYQHGF